MANPFVVRLPPTALPPSLAFEEAALTPDGPQQMAYDRARRVEQLDHWPALPSAPDSTCHLKWPEKLEPKVAGRLLGYILIQAPNQKSADAIARDINGCGSERSQEHGDYHMADLARFYSMTLLKTFLKNAGKTPYVSSHSSRSPFDAQQPETRDGAEESDRVYGQVREKVFERDKYSCVLTEWLSDEHYLKLDELKQEELDSRHVTCQNLHCVHIIPHMLNSSVETPKKSYYVSAIWTILERGGSINIDERNGELLDGLDSMLIMAPHFHAAFHHLKLWFTHEQDDTYRVEAVRPGLLGSIVHNPVTFTTTNPDDYPLPAKQFFQLHRACARVFHLSGVAEYIEDIIRDEEEIGMRYGHQASLMDIGHSSFYDRLTSLAERPSVQ